MSEPWTDERIREGFIYDGGEAEYHDPINGEEEQRRIAGGIFDRWLAEHDRQVAERAWNACRQETYNETGNDYLDDVLGMTNPYRAAKGGQK